jgi:hypothetical protein
VSFLSFFCLVAQARYLGVILNKSGEHGHTCGGNAFKSSPFSVMLVMGLSYITPKLVFKKTN